MANKIPLIVNPTAKQIQELQTNDHLQLNDTNKLKLGTDREMLIFHDATGNSVIQHSPQSQGDTDLRLKIAGNQFVLEKSTGKNFMTASHDDYDEHANEVSLFYADNATTDDVNRKLSTAGIGITVFGRLQLFNTPGTGTQGAELKIGEAAGSVEVDIIRDEDTMVSDDPKALATQQSIKAYVDANKPICKSSQLSSDFDNSSTSYQTALTRTFTPSSADAKLLVMVTGEVIGNDGGGAGDSNGIFRCFEGSTAIGVEITSFAKNDASVITQNILRTPGSTAQKTYTLKVKSNNGNTHGTIRKGATLTILEVS